MLSCTYVFESCKKATVKLPRYCAQKHLVHIGDKTFVILSSLFTFFDRIEVHQLKTYMNYCDLTRQNTQLCNNLLLHQWYPKTQLVMWQDILAGKMNTCTIQYQNFLSLVFLIVGQALLLDLYVTLDGGQRICQKIESFYIFP